MVDLAITTSTAVVGVAIGAEGTVAAAEHQRTDRRHAEELIPMVQRVLATASIQLTKVDRVVIDVGPGRFTGLRVGVTTARSLAFALGVGLVPLSSLEILAGAETARGPVLAVVDARRQEVFQQLFEQSRPIGEAAVGPPADLFAGVATSDIVAIGDGVDRYPQVYRGAGKPGRGVQADVMLQLAVGRPAQEGSLVGPLYLREPDVNPSIKTRGRPAKN